MTTRQEKQTPNLDALLDHAEWKHLAEWFGHAVREDEAAETLAAIDRALGSEPELLATRTWREIADRGVL